MVGYQAATVTWRVQRRARLPHGTPERENSPEREATKWNGQAPRTLPPMVASTGSPGGAVPGWCWQRRIWRRQRGTMYTLARENRQRASSREGSVMTCGREAPHRGTGASLHACRSDFGNVEAQQIMGVMQAREAGGPSYLTNVCKIYGRGLLRGLTGVLGATLPQGEAGEIWLQESCLQTRQNAFLLVFSPLPGALREAAPTATPPSSGGQIKSDLGAPERSSLEEGRSLAVMLSCKHIETSAALHHNTRELFEGAVRQIRLRRHRPAGDGGPGGRRESLTKKAKRFLSSLVPRNGRFFKQRSKSCNDLSVL
uniref:Uncharacterized protein n=1 Tax=Chelonoidis abingdonii TaxID=106734 RepID=A0A8C0H1Z5_CHEAB